MVGDDISGFCFPFGSFDEKSVEAVRSAGYDYACVTDDHSFPDRFRIPRAWVGQSDDGLRLTVRVLRERARVRRASARLT